MDKLGESVNRGLANDLGSGMAFSTHDLLQPLYQYLVMRMKWTMAFMCRMTEGLGDARVPAHIGIAVDSHFAHAGL